jgi:hypothetical protein
MPYRMGESMQFNECERLRIAQKKGLLVAIGLSAVWLGLGGRFSSGCSPSESKMIKG